MCHRSHIAYRCRLPDGGTSAWKPTLVFKACWCDGRSSRIEVKSHRSRIVPRFSRQSVESRPRCACTPSRSYARAGPPRHQAGQHPDRRRRQAVPGRFRPGAPGRRLRPGAGFAGTPAYTSPEQARGEGHRVDGRSRYLQPGRRPLRALDRPAAVPGRFASRRCWIRSPRSIRARPGRSTTRSPGSSSESA